MNEFVPVERGWPSHSKTFRLKRSPLGFAALGHLVVAWCNAIEHAPNGRVAADEVEDIAEWTGEPGALLAALIDARFYDPETGELRGWMKRAGAALQKIAEATEKKREADRDRVAKKRVESQPVAPCRELSQDVAPSRKVSQPVAPCRDTETETETETEEEEEAREARRDPTPPPLASLTDQDRAAVAALTGKAQRAAERAPSPFVAQLADRARATIIPRGSGSLQPDAQEVAAWEEILAREPESEWERWWVPRLVELLKSIAGSEKHGPGGSFTVASPQQLLRKSAPRDPASKLILDEMLVKFPTRLETPEKRAKRERAVFVDERTRELEVEAIQKLGRTRLKTGEEHAIRQQVEREWDARQRAGPAPPDDQRSTNTSTVSTSSREGIA